MKIYRDRLILSIALGTISSLLYCFGIAPTRSGEIIRAQDMTHGLRYFIGSWFFCTISIYALCSLFTPTVKDLICPSCEHVEEVPKIIQKIFFALNVVKRWCL